MLAWWLVGLTAAAAAPETVLVLFAEKPTGLAFEVDGVAVTATHGSVFRVPVTPGVHAVVARKGSKELGRSEVTVPESHEARCKWVDAALDCYKFVDLTVAETTVKAGTTGANSNDLVYAGAAYAMYGAWGAGMAAAVVDANGGAAPSTLALTVRALDGVDVDVWVDGALAAEVREAELTVTVPAGARKVAFHAPGAAEPYAKGTLDAGTRTMAILVVEGQQVPRALDGAGWVVEP